MISIHTFLTEGDESESAESNLLEISIHTFLTEGDILPVGCTLSSDNFNPHLPYGRWHDYRNTSGAYNYFNPHLPYGRWLNRKNNTCIVDIFQSTPSLRKVTQNLLYCIVVCNNFNPHLPYGRWQVTHHFSLQLQCISIHTFLTEGDARLNAYRKEL